MNQIKEMCQMVLIEDHQEIVNICFEFCNIVSNHAVFNPKKRQNMCSRFHNI